MVAFSPRLCTYTACRNHFQDIYSAFGGRSETHRDKNPTRGSPQLPERARKFCDFQVWRNWMIMPLLD